MGEIDRPHVAHRNEFGGMGGYKRRKSYTSKYEIFYEKVTKNLVPVFINAEKVPEILPENHEQPFAGDVQVIFKIIYFAFDKKCSLGANNANIFFLI